MFSNCSHLGITAFYSHFMSRALFYISLKILMVFGTFLLFPTLSFFPDKKFTYLFWSLYWMLSLKNLLMFCCLPTCQHKGLKRGCEALWPWHGIESQASLRCDVATSGLFHGETLQYNCTLTLCYCLLM